jgi:hypothetical protein
MVTDGSAPGASDTSPVIVIVGVLVAGVLIAGAVIFLGVIIFVTQQRKKTAR